MLNYQRVPHDVTCLLQYICVYSTLCMYTCVYHNMHAVWAYNVLYVQMCSFTNRNTNMSLIHRNTSDRFVFTMHSSLVQFLSLPTPVPDLDMASWVAKLGIELSRCWDNPHIHEKKKTSPSKHCEWSKVNISETDLTDQNAKWDLNLKNIKDQRIAIPSQKIGADL